MSDDKMSVFPDMIESASNAVHQNLPETEKETDGVISTVVGFFNNVVLYPVKKANLTFRYKLEAFKDDLEEKIKVIPLENLQVPPTMIAGPALEALKYTYDEEELREMYETLLASAMDNRKLSSIHPSYVDAIKQMSPLDAIVLNKIADYHQLRCVEIKFLIEDGVHEYGDAMPNNFCLELYDLGDPFSVSRSIINLVRLGLIKIFNGIIKEADYEELVNHPYVSSRKELFEKDGQDITIEKSNKVIITTDYGDAFINVCLNKEI